MLPRERVRRLLSRMSSAVISIAKTLSVIFARATQEKGKRIIAVERTTTTPLSLTAFRPSLSK